MENDKMNIADVSALLEWTITDVVIYMNDKHNLNLNLLDEVKEVNKHIVNKYFNNIN